jgi:hypothetical protein
MACMGGRENNGVPACRPAARDGVRDRNPNASQQAVPACDPECVHGGTRCVAYVRDTVVCPAGCRPDAPRHMQFAGRPSLVVVSTVRCSLARAKRLKAITQFERKDGIVPYILV